MSDARASLILRIATPTPVRLWGGAGLFETPSDDVLDPSAIYGPLAGSGRPNIGALPVMRQLIGGTAEAIDFTFSGVESVPASWVDDGAAYGARLNLGLIFFGADLQQQGAIWWMWTGIVGPATDTGDATTSVVTLNVESACAARSRAGLKMWTNSSHRQRHPTDGFLRRVVRNGLNNSPKWPG